MRLLLLAVVAVAAVTGVLVAAATVRVASARDRKELRAARWQVAHHSENGVTLVCVERVTPVSKRVLEQQVVATIRDVAPEYDQEFLQAVSAAQERAALLNSVRSS